MRKKDWLNLGRVYFAYTQTYYGVAQYSKENGMYDNDF